MAHCPECETVIDVDEDEVEEGQAVDCPECGAALEVVNTNPLQLDLISDEEEEEEGEW
jgi:alpha-aminoadipate carrier protein LysW